MALFTLSIAMTLQDPLAQVPAATTGGGLNSTPSRTATGEATAKKAKAPRFVGSPCLSHLQIKPNNGDKDT